MLLTILAGLSGFLLLALTPARYVAEVRFTHMAEENGRPLSLEERKALLSSHARTLLDPGLLSEVARNADARLLVDRGQGAQWLLTLLTGQAATTRSEPSSEDDRDAQQVVRLLAHMSIRAEPEAGALAVTLTSADADAASGFLDALAKAHLARQSRQAGEERLVREVEALRADAARSEAAAEVWRRVLAQIRSQGEDAGALTARAAALSAELKEAEELEQRVRAQARFVRDDLAQRGVAVSPAAPPSLKDLLDEQARLERQLASGHGGGAGTGDEMLRLKALRQQIAREFARLTPALEAQADAAGKLVTVLRQRLEEVSQRAEAARALESEVDALSRAAERQRSEADQRSEELEGLHKEARTSPALQPAGPPAVEAIPGPRRGPIVLSLMVLALLAGVAAVTLRELLRRAPSRTPWAAASRPAEPEPVVILGGDRFATISSLRAAAALLVVRSELQRGFRLLVTSEAPEVPVNEDARELARALSEADRKVVLIHWSLQGSDLEGGAVSRALPGINDLIVGTRTFEEIVRTFDGSGVHVIEAGATVTDRSAALEPNRLNMVFDALDEVYDTIVVAASREEARELFAALEGRFDACLSVARGEAGEGEAGPFEARPGAFLGFEVSDIDILRYRPRRHAPGLEAGPDLPETRVA
jgi:Mrp family chromosome partitioning ATPase